MAEDKTLVAEFTKKRDADLHVIEEKLEDAKENAGDVEIKNALLEKADLYCKIGDHNNAIKFYDEAYN